MNDYEARKYIDHVFSEVLNAARLAEQHELKIPHIQLVRAATGMGLKEAKETVEQHWKSLRHDRMRQEVLDLVDTYGSSSLRHFVETNL